MIESLLINRAVVYDLLRKHGKNDLIFTARQISALKKLLEFLKTFKQATKKLQGERYPTLSLAWPYVCSKEIVEPLIVLTMILIMVTML